MIFLRCSGVSLTYVYFCVHSLFFIDLISCFIPSVVCSLSKPSVLLTQGSRRIFLLWSPVHPHLMLLLSSVLSLLWLWLVISSSLLLVAPELSQVCLLLWLSRLFLLALVSCLVWSHLLRLFCLVSAMEVAALLAELLALCHWKVCKCWWCCSVWLSHGL